MEDHRDTEVTEGTEGSSWDRGADNLLSEKIIGAAVEVHRYLGPGLLESAYLECLLREMSLRGLSAARQVPLDLHYKGIVVRNAYRPDVLVEGRILVELKAVEGLEEVHRAQILTYFRLTNLRLGLLINFHTPILSKGVRRIINGF